MPDFFFKTKESLFIHRPNRIITRKLIPAGDPIKPLKLQGEEICHLQIEGIPKETRGNIALLIESWSIQYRFFRWRTKSTSVSFHTSCRSKRHLYFRLCSAAGSVPETMVAFEHSLEYHFLAFAYLVHPELECIKINEHFSSVVLNSKRMLNIYCRVNHSCFLSFSSHGLL